MPDLLCTCGTLLWLLCQPLSQFLEPSLPNVPVMLSLFLSFHYTATTTTRISHFRSQCGQGRKKIWESFPFSRREMEIGECLPGLFDFNVTLLNSYTSRSTQRVSSSFCQVTCFSLFLKYFIYLLHGQNTVCTSAGCVGRVWVEAEGGEGERIYRWLFVD